MTSLTSGDDGFSSGYNDVIFNKYNFGVSFKKFASNHFCNKVIQTLQSILITVAGL